MADSFVFGRHDLGIEDTDGSILGLMCAKDKGVPLYEEHDSKYLSDQYYTNTPDQTYIDPEKEIPLVQSDYRSGFGLEVADPTDPLRYYASYGMDLRHRGMAIAGWKTTGIAIPTYPAKIADPGMEAWDDANNLTNWTLNQISGTLVLDREPTTTHSGTFSAKITSEGGEEGELYQDVPTWNNNYQGKQITVKAWIRTSDPANTKLRINDGVGTTEQAASLTNTFEEVTVTRTLDGSATRIRIGTWLQSGTTVYTDGFSSDIPYADGVKAFADFNDLLYTGGGNILWKLNGAGNGWTLVESFITAEAGDPAGMITDLEPFPNSTAAGEDILLIARGVSLLYYEMTAAEGFTISDLSVNAKFLQRVDAATPVMWASVSDYEIKKSADPAAGGTAWSGITTVDTSFNAITDFITKSGALYICKEDMIYYLDSNEAVQNDLAPKLRILTSPTSGKNAITDGDKIMYPAGDQSLLEIDGTTLTWRTPATYATNLSDFNGRVFAVSFDDQYWFVALDNSTKVEILAGREEVISGATRFVWHPIHEMTLTGVETMFVSPVFQKRLWIASTSSSDSIFYLPLPKGYGDIINDGNRDFETDTYFYTSWRHGGFKADDKSYYKATATLGHTFDTDIYFELHYKKLGDSTWTDAGDFKGTATDRKPVLFIPVDGSSNKPTSTMMYFKIVAKTDDVLKTPQLLNFDVRAILYPPRTDVILTRITAAQETTLRDGQTETNQTNVIKTLMDNIEDSTWPRKFYPIDYNPTDNNFIYVKPLPLPRGTKKREVIKDEQGREKEYAYNLFLQEVKLS